MSKNHKKNYDDYNKMCMIPETTENRFVQPRGNDEMQKRLQAQPETEKSDAEICMSTGGAWYNTSFLGESKEGGLQPKEGESGQCLQTDEDFAAACISDGGVPEFHQKESGERHFNSCRDPNAVREEKQIQLAKEQAAMGCMPAWRKSSSGEMNVNQICLDETQHVPERKLNEAECTEKNGHMVGPSPDNLYCERPLTNSEKKMLVDPITGKTRDGRTPQDAYLNPPNIVRRRGPAISANRTSPAAQRENQRKGCRLKADYPQRSLDADDYQKAHRSRALARKKYERCLNGQM